MQPVVVAVHCSPKHTFSKPAQMQIRLVEGLGVEGDAHNGATVKHRSRVAKDATQPNLRQVHLIHSELHDELRALGFEVQPGELGENITTSGLDVLALTTGTLLHIGEDAVIRVTGLRNPCVQIDRFRAGMLKACLAKDDQGEVVYKAGIMAVVLKGGDVRPGDAINVELPEGAQEALKLV
jgi:MOSC domain-containing protein YiiM